jgi:hypothetical protein
MAGEDKTVLLRKAGYGYWTAFLGLALQLVGVTWDALQHHLDPELAARESVLSLTNPSHLLIGFGMVLAVAGVAWGMLLVSGGGSGFRLFWGPTLAIAVLLVLSVSTSVIAFATGGLSGSHEHQSGHSGITVDDPVLAELRGVLVMDGTGAALDRLEELAAEDENLEGESHHLVHELGKFSYLHYGGEAAKAFGLCDRRFAGGCYHGVVQAYFEVNPDFEAGDLAGLCEGEIVDAEAAEILRHQCVHGLGHGLSLYLDRDLQETLRHCDALRTDRDRDSCYGGAFMENIMFAQSQHGRQSDPDRGTSLLKEDDLHYPCNSVGERYKQQCYFLQPAAILFQNGRDVDGAFEECDKAPKPYVAACYRGMGRDISSLTRGDTDEPRDLCTLGTDSNEVWCFEGAVMLLVSSNWRTDEAVDFCSGAPAEAKSRCFESIGEMIPGLHADTASRNEECEKAEEERWVTVCRRTAGLGHSSGDERL